MKKTLMALGLALCTSLVFAQMPAKKETRALKESNGVEKVAKIDDSYQHEATFKGSIFTKTDVFRTVDFSDASAYTVGTMGANSYSPRHTQTKGYAQWFRVADTTAGACATASTANEAVVMFSQNWFPNLSFFTSATPTNGLMAMSMIDYINGFATGTFNSYIEINNVNTVTDGSQFALDLKLFQYYQKFNADVCCIDYSTNNGQTWDTLEFNIKNIEVAVNSGTFGWKRVALPTSLSNQADLDLRIRWFSNSNDGGTYGYYWFIDDVTVESAEDSRISVTKEEYYNGAYHLVPEGMDLNTLVWYALYRNTGLIAQTNIQGYVKDANTGAEIAATVVEPTVAPDVYEFKYSFVDQSNNVNNTTGDQSVTGLGISGTVNSYASTTGVHDIYSGMRSDASDFVFDTMRYTVLAPEDGTRVWGRDNGILTQYSSWTYGLTADGYLTDDANYIDAGYSVNIVLNSGSVVPEGWVIRGVEYVAATDPDLVNVSDIEGGYVKIIPTLSYDSMGGEYIFFRSIETGAGVHTVTPAEVQLAEDATTNYFMPGQYNTIRVMFPEQPELKANTAYRVGYELAEQGYFCLASDANRYWDIESGADTAVYYYEDEVLAPYQYRFGNGYGLNVRVNTPEAGRATWLATSAGKNVPMIRLLVGPRQEIEKHAINISVNDTAMGYIYNAATYEGCVGVDSVANGGSRTYLVAPNEEIYELAAIQLDGADLDLYGNNPVYNPEGGYYEYTLSNIIAPHSIHAIFRGVGLNAVEDNVKVSLQPNPANAQAKLAIEGVNGEVNFSLIDMSGRVISSEVINANEVKTINVSGLAKGTYFVRLTNSNFSKVEKLIVR